MNRIEYIKWTKIKVLLFCTSNISTCVSGLAMTVSSWIVNMIFSTQFHYPSFISVYCWYDFMIVLLFFFIVNIISEIDVSCGWTSVLFFYCSDNHCRFITVDRSDYSMPVFLGWYILNIEVILLLFPFMVMVVYLLSPCESSPLLRIANKIYCSTIIAILPRL